VLASRIHSQQKMGDKQMQKIFNSQPVFRWQQYEKDTLLYCGTVLLATLQFHRYANGHEYYRFKHATFFDALRDAVPGYWENDAFYLKGTTFAEIAEPVEQFYATTFDQLDFNITLE
jgi:hypothetical protein